MTDLVHTISDERLAEMIIAAYRRGHAWCLENPGSEEYLAKAAYDYADKALSSLEASPAPVSGEMAKPTVEQAIESLVSALDEMRSQQAKRDEFLATLIVNIEKNEPTAEFAVNLREYVRNGRAALAAKGGQ